MQALHSAEGRMMQVNRMYEKTKDDIWHHLADGLSREDMDRRIKAAVSQRGWEEVVRIFTKRNIPIEALNVAEVGCGRGTMSLTFGLMGSAVTLIDINGAVLERAGKIYGEYARMARLVKGDCLEGPPAGLEGAFDLVISSGLAEHFTGDYRRRCIEYHRRLAKKGGVVFITVPNVWNMPYWCIRAVRALTGTWTIDVEAPFSASELIRFSHEAGFADAYVIGYAGFWRDFFESLRGFRSAIASGLPRGWVKAIKRRGACMKETPPLHPQVKEDMRLYCRQVAEAVKKYPRAVRSFADMYISELALIAFK